MAETKTCARCEEERTEFFFVSSENPDVCGTCREELRQTPPVNIALDSTNRERSSYDPELTCIECGRQNDRTARYCRECNAPLAGSSSAATTMVGTLTATSRSKSRSELNMAATSQGGTPNPTAEEIREAQDREQIKKVFIWFVWGWVAFFVLAYVAVDVKRGIELIVSVFFGVSAAFVSTLIYWGVKEFRKSNAGNGHRAAAAESEIAELRRKVEELSNKADQ